MAHESVQAQEKITFEIAFKEPQAHYVEVTMHVEGLHAGFTDVQMPVWTPGSYLIREFPKNVEGFKAQSDRKDIRWEKINKNTWRVYHEERNYVTLRYRVYAFEVSVRTSFVDASRAFLSPTGIFMYLDGKINLPSEVTIQPYAGWSTISTGLERVKGKDNTFYAPNFDILFDSPFEIGNQEIFTFEAAGVIHEIAMVGGGNYDQERLKTDIAKIVETQTEMYGENPNKRYVFIVHNYQTGSGGLEHLNSTVLGASRFAYNTEKGYEGFLGLVSHEYFHLWNVKRLRPENLGPFDYSVENYTPNLWISEGFTAYYDNLTLRRCDLYSVAEYLRVLADDVNVVENRPGNRVQSLVQSSFDAWIKHYRPDENSHNTTVTYYNKGALIAWILDLKILAVTDGKRRLDDVMRAMYRRYYKEEDRGFTRREFEVMVQEIAGDALDEIFSYVDRAVPIPYNRYLNEAGLALIDTTTDQNIPTLGIKTVDRDGKIIVTTVERDSGAWQAGINVKDELIAFDNYRIGHDLEEMVKARKVGEEIRVTVARDGMMQTLPITLFKDPRKRYTIEPMESTTDRQQHIRKIWLSDHK